MPITKKDLTGVKTTAAPLSTDLFNRIKEDILSGKLKKDQKLIEQSICDEYKVSRTPVREALLQLEMEGLIEMVPNRGAFVLGISPGELDDMFTLRKIYEMQAVRWAIQRITDEEMAQLEETFDFMEFYTLKGDVDKMLNINVNFHQTIYKASHNRMLQNLLASYQAYIRHGSCEFEEKQEYLNVVLAEHRAIFQAFVDRDEEAGVRAMEIHMDHSKARHRPTM